MKKWKISVLVIVISAMLLGLLACDGGTPPAQSQNSTSGEIDDLKDRSEEKLEIPLVKVLLWYSPDEATQKVFADFEEKFDAEVKRIETTWSEMQTMLIAGVATGDPADIAYIYDQYNPSKNVYQSVEDYFDLSDSFWDKSKMEVFQWEGKYYGVCNRTSANLLLMFYNKTMLENYGQPDPVALDESDEWTWEKFQEIAVAVTADTNADGVLDNWGYSTAGKDLLPFLMSNDNKFIVFDDQGYPRVNFDDPQMIRPLEFIQNFRNNTNAIGDGDFMSSTAAFFTGEVSQMSQIHKSTFRDKWDFVRIPYGPDNSRKAVPSYVTGWSIPNGAKNPHGGARLMRYWMSYEGEPTEDSLVSFLSEEQYDRLDGYYDAVNPENYSFGNIGSTLFWDLWNKVNTYDLSISSTLAELKPLWQAEIDRVMTSKGVITDGEEFLSPGVIDFEDGLIPEILRVNDQFVSVTDNPAEVISGTWSLVAKPDGETHFLIETIPSLLKIEPGHEYNIKFDYKLIDALPRGATYGISFKYTDAGFLGAQFFKGNKDEVRTFEGKIGVFENLGNYYFQMTTNGALGIVIDNIEITTTPKAE